MFCIRCLSLWGMLAKGLVWWATNWDLLSLSPQSSWYSLWLPQVGRWWWWWWWWWWLTVSSIDHGLLCRKNLLSMTLDFDPYKLCLLSILYTVCLWWLPGHRYADDTHLYDNGDNEWRKNWICASLKLDHGLAATSWNSNDNKTDVLILASHTPVISTLLQTLLYMLMYQYYQAIFSGTLSSLSDQTLNYEIAHNPYTQIIIHSTMKHVMF